MSETRSREKLHKMVLTAVASVDLMQNYSPCYSTTLKNIDCIFVVFSPCHPPENKNCRLLRFGNFKAMFITENYAR